MADLCLRDWTFLKQQYVVRVALLAQFVDLTKKHLKKQSCHFHQTSTVAPALSLPCDFCLVFQVPENGHHCCVHIDCIVGPDELSVINGIHKECNFNASQL